MSFCEASFEKELNRMKQIAKVERMRASTRDGTAAHTVRNNAGRKRTPEGKAIVNALTDKIQTCSELAEKAGVSMRSAANILKHLSNSSVAEIELISIRQRGYRRGPKWKKEV